jgi:hypothetical protein
MADNTLPQNNLRYTRRGGSGFTVFLFGGMPIAFAQQVSHQSPRLVNNPSFIQPMDEPYVVEILTPVAAGPGTLVLNLLDLWSQSDKNVDKIWDRLGNGGGASDGTPNADGSIPGADTTGTGQGSASVTGGGIFKNASDILDVVIAQAQATPSQMSIVQYIRQIPNMQGIGGPARSGYTQYHGCTITDVRDDETIQVGTLEIVKQITVNYTYSTRQGSTNSALALRNGV